MSRIGLPLVGAALAAGVLFGCGGGGQAPTPASSPSAASTTQKASAAGQSREGGAQSAQANPGESAGAESTPSEAEPPTDYAEEHLPFGAAPLTASQRSRLVNGGAVSVPVHVDSAGEISGFGQAEVEGRIEKVAQAAPVSASGAGSVSLDLRLTHKARRALARGESILMYVAIKFSKSRTLQRLAVPLTP